jgi:hypothetical protein
MTDGKLKQPVDVILDDLAVYLTKLLRKRGEVRIVDDALGLRRGGDAPELLGQLDALVLCLPV